MSYEWDDAKRARNLAKHGVDFAEPEAFDWETALETFDSRDDYGEDRWVAVGFIGETLHVMAYTERGGSVRIISLRRATRNEERFYAENTQAAD